MMSPASRELRDHLEAAAEARRRGDNAAADWHEADAARVLRRILTGAACPPEREARH